MKDLASENNRVFRDNVTDVDEVVDSTIWTVSECACQDRALRDVPLHDLHLPWDACLKGGSIVKPVKKASW